MVSSKQIAALAVVALCLWCLPFVAAQETDTGDAVTAEAFRSINVRSGPSTDFPVIGQLHEGKVVRVMGRSDPQSNWLLIDNNGQVGWVAFFTVVVTGDPTTLEIVGTRVAEPIAAQEVFTVTPETAAQSALYVTAYRRVNVRSGPGTEFSIVDVLAPGESADIVGSSGEDNEWLEITIEDDTGWVAYFVVNISGDISALEPSAEAPPVGEEAPMIAQSAAASVLAEIDSNQVLLITRFNTNLRAEPRFGAFVITVVPYETTLEAEARTADSNWLRVTYEGHTGWLIASLVNTGVSDVNSLPVAPGIMEPTPTPTA